MRKFPAMIATVIDREKLVMNRGSKDGVRIGQRYLVYNLGDEIIDPETNQSLGVLEIVKGTGKVVHLQEMMATIESDMFEESERVIRKRKNSAFSIAFGDDEETITPKIKKMFEHAVVEDKVKPI